MTIIDKLAKFQRDIQHNDALDAFACSVRCYNKAIKNNQYAFLRNGKLDYSFMVVGRQDDK